MIFFRLMPHIIFGTVLMAAPVKANAETKKLVFSQIDASSVHVKATHLIQTVYDRLGIDVSFQRFPARRALKMSNLGETDGEVLRIWGIEKRYPNLIRVPTPFNTLHGYAFTLKLPVINSFEKIGVNQRVGLQRGILWAEKAVSNKKWVVHVTTVGDLVDKLLAGAIDVALATEDGVEAEFKRRNLTFNLYKGEPVIHFPVYHYLHKDHSEIVGKVDAEVKKMIANDEINKIADFPYHSHN